MVWTAEFDHALDTNGGGWAQYSIRQIIPASALSLGGEQIKLEVAASTAENCTIDNAAIVEQSSGANGAGVPTEILFSGGSGFSILAGQTIISDALSYTLDPAKSYIAILDFGTSTASDGIRYKSQSGWDYYYKASANSYNQQNVSGFTLNSNYVISIKALYVPSGDAIQLGPFASAAWGKPYSQGAWR